MYIVHFTQARGRAGAVADERQPLTRPEKQIAELIGGFRFAARSARRRQVRRHGVGVHHAGLLPKYRCLVERLAQAGLLKVICGTDTLGVGINVPIRTVLFTAARQIRRHEDRLLCVRDFHQIGGSRRAQRLRQMGNVIAQAPEHVIENHKAAGRPRRGPSRTRSPQDREEEAARGQVSWGQPTFDRLVAAPPEPLTSSFTVSHSMLLNVLEPARRRTGRSSPPPHRELRDRGQAGRARGPRRGPVRLAPRRRGRGGAR